MKITLPSGYEIPAGVEPGQDFDAVVTLSLGDDGTVTVTALDGAPIEDIAEEVEEEDTEETDEDEADFVGAVNAELTSGGYT